MKAKSWVRQIKHWREELERASAAPDIAGACILLTRRMPHSQFECSAISLASHPKDANYQLPDRSLLNEAYQEYKDDPVVIALIERIHSSWRPQSLIQWRIEEGKAVPTILHAKPSRGKDATSAGLNAMMREALSLAGAQSLLGMLHRRELPYEESGMQRLAASTDQSRAPIAKRPSAGDICQEIKAIIRSASEFSRESLTREILSRHPEWDEATKSLVPDCVSFEWRKVVAKYRLT